MNKLTKRSSVVMLQSFQSVDTAEIFADKVLGKTCLLITSVDKRTVSILVVDQGLIDSLQLALNDSEAVT